MASGKANDGQHPNKLHNKEQNFFPSFLEFVVWPILRIFFIRICFHYKAFYLKHLGLAIRWLSSYKQECTLGNLRNPECGSISYKSERLLWQCGERSAALGLSSWHFWFTSQLNAFHQLLHISLHSSSLRKKGGD